MPKSGVGVKSNEGCAKAVRIAAELLTFRGLAVKIKVGFQMMESNKKF